MTANANVQSLHDAVTTRIISELEAGRVPWVQPWASSGATPLGLPHNAATGRTYSGINILLLWAAAIGQGRPSHRWLTFKQALSLGGCVRKGEKGTMVVYADTFVPKAEQAKASTSGDEARASASSRGSLPSMSTSATGCRPRRLPCRFRATPKACRTSKLSLRRLELISGSAGGWRSTLPCMISSRSRHRRRISSRSTGTVPSCMSWGTGQGMPRGSIGIFPGGSATKCTPAKNSSPSSAQPFSAPNLAWRRPSGMRTISARGLMF